MLYCMDSILKIIAWLFQTEESLNLEASSLNLGQALHGCNYESHMLRL